MLLTDGFGGFGGISQFNRDFLQALDASSTIGRVQVLPRLILHSFTETIPEAVVYDRAAARGKRRYLWEALRHAWPRNRADIVICGHINLLPVAWLVAKCHRARLVLIIHGIEAWQPSPDPIGRRLVRTLDSVIAVSRFSAERFAAWSRVPLERIAVLPNCVNLDRFVPAPRDGALAARYDIAQSPVIMTLGRLAEKERYKGFDEVIEVLPLLTGRFPNLRYLIVGDGKDQPRLQEKAQALGVDRNVVFAGRISEDEKVAHYALADVYVMPSSGEGFGIVLLEAAACGVPVIGSEADGSREALLNGELGALVAPANRELLTGLIAAALETPQPHRRKPAIANFGIDRFRARVHDWLMAQIPNLRKAAS